MSRNFVDELALGQATDDFTGGAGVPTVDLRGRKAGTDRVCDGIPEGLPPSKARRGRAGRSEGGSLLKCRLMFRPSWALH